MLNSPPPAASPGLLVDPSTDPSTVYDGLNYRNSDGGVTWTALPKPPFDVSKVETFNVDPAGNLCAPVAAGPMYVSRDQGQSWMQIGSPTPSSTTEQGGPAVTGIAAAGSTGILYDTVVTGGTRPIDFQTVKGVQAANAGGSDAFAAILSGDGSRLNYATFRRLTGRWRPSRGHRFLGGHHPREPDLLQRFPDQRPVSAALRNRRCFRDPGQPQIESKSQANIFGGILRRILDQKR